MKRIYFLLSMVFLGQMLVLLLSCSGRDPNYSSDTGDTTPVLPRPSSNSDATNPSMPDTALIKQDSTHVADSTQRR